jgi:predicted RNA-binding protein
LERQLIQDALRDLVNQLPGRLRRVIVGRYGLGEQPSCMLKGLGKELGLTGERVRQLQQEALAWLRHPAHSWRLRQLVDENTAADYRRALARNAALFAEAEAGEDIRAMSSTEKLTAIQKRAQNAAALKPFVLVVLKQKLPLVFPRAINLSPSPKPRYRSAYCYLGFDGLNEETLETYSPFEIAG